MFRRFPAATGPPGCVRTEKLPLLVGIGSQGKSDVKDGWMGSGNRRTSTAASLPAGPCPLILQGVLPGKRRLLQALWILMRDNCPKTDSKKIYTLWTLTVLANGLQTGVTWNLLEKNIPAVNWQPKSLLKMVKYDPA